MISLPGDSVLKYPPPFHTLGPYAPQIYLDTASSIGQRVEDLLGHAQVELGRSQCDPDAAADQDG